MTKVEQRILQMFKGQYLPLGSECIEMGFFQSNFPGISTDVGPFNSAMDSLIGQGYIVRRAEASYCLTEEGKVKAGVKPKPNSGEG